MNTLWKRIGIDNCLTQALRDREFTAPIGDAIYAMVAKRALAPSSKLAVEEWAAKDVHLDIQQPLQAQHFYRGMDFLLEHATDIQKKVFWATAQLMNLTVDLIFFDTTNTYFAMENVKNSELLAFGKAKHTRDDLPQVTIGLAATREGILVPCCVFHGRCVYAEERCRTQIPE